MRESHVPAKGTTAQRGYSSTPDRLRSTYRWRELAKKFKAHAAAHNLACVHCRQPIDYNAKPGTPSAFEADHRKPLATHPHLAYVWSNIDPSHSSCNRSRGSQAADQGEWVAANW